VVVGLAAIQASQRHNARDSAHEFSDLHFVGSPVVVPAWRSVGFTNPLRCAFILQVRCADENSSSARVKSKK
jgi:hypothetical protein